MLVGTWLVGPTRAATRVRQAARPVVASVLWSYGLVAAAMVVLATFLPAFQRSLVTGFVFLAILVAGVEVIRRSILSDTTPAIAR